MRSIFTYHRGLVEDRRDYDSFKSGQSATQKVHRQKTLKNPKKVKFA